MQVRMCSTRGTGGNGWCGTALQVSKYGWCVQVRMAGAVQAQGSKLGQHMLHGAVVPRYAAGHTWDAEQSRKTVEQAVGQHHT